VRGLHGLVIGRQGQRRILTQQVLRHGFGVLEVLEQRFGVRVFEVVGRELLLSLQEDIAVTLAALFGRDAVPVQLVDVVNALHVHDQAFKTVGELQRDRVTVDAADLLEVGELADFHTVTPDFPAQAPGAQSRAFPVILDKANIVFLQVDAQHLQRAKVERLCVDRARLHQHLKLIVVLQPVGVVAVAAIGRTARGLDVGGVPDGVADRAQRRRRVEGSRANFHVVGLQHHTALLGPVGLQVQHKALKTGGFVGPLFLEGHGVWLSGAGHWSRSAPRLTPSPRGIQPRSQGPPPPRLQPLPGKKSPEARPAPRSTARIGPRAPGVRAP